MEIVFDQTSLIFSIVMGYSTLSVIAMIGMIVYLAIETFWVWKDGTRVKRLIEENRIKRDR